MTLPGSLTRVRVKFCASPRITPARSAASADFLISPAIQEDVQLLNTLVLAVRAIRIRIKVTDVSALDQCTRGGCRFQSIAEGDRDGKLAQFAWLGEADRRTGGFTHFGSGEPAQAHNQQPLRFDSIRSMQQDGFAAAAANSPLCRTAAAAFVTALLPVSSLTAVFVELCFLSAASNANTTSKLV